MSTQSSSADNPLASFGPNEWIVEDIYQQFLADPTSVDPAWHEFFADYKPGAPAESGNGSAPAADGHNPPGATHGQRTGTTAVATPAPAAARVPAPATAPAAPAKPAVAPKPAPAVAAQPAAAKPAAPAEGGRQTLRGAAARIVVNMDASLAVPTAT
ncbi:MAG: multifunctional 2-oxoglutarate metabolism enzyme, partial [Cryptosporangiaceae bacterium]|nr:multifunctional 2-oxoglutarate metabolism enzyme [Cryptosporangiaceae bacterium]